MATKILTGLVTLLWACGLYIGGLALHRHQWTAGAAATAPATKSFAKPGSAGTMLVFLHPECPCSRATLTELAHIQDAAGDALHTTLYFYQPHGLPDSWHKGALWQQASAMPSVEKCVDLDGRTAAKYGAHVSGQVLVYSARTTQLVFSGGITDGRGHEGGNPGEAAILTFIAKGTMSKTTTPVYGCVIQ